MKDKRNPYLVGFEGALEQKLDIPVLLIQATETGENLPFIQEAFSQFIANHPESYPPGSEQLQLLLDVARSIFSENGPLNE